MPEQPARADKCQIVYTRKMKGERLLIQKKEKKNIQGRDANEGERLVNGTERENTSPDEGKNNGTAVTLVERTPTTGREWNTSAYGRPLWTGKKRKK